MGRPCRQAEDVRVRRLILRIEDVVLEDLNADEANARLRAWKTNSFRVNRATGQERCTPKDALVAAIARRTVGHRRQKLGTRSRGSPEGVQWDSPGFKHMS